MESKSHLKYHILSLASFAILFCILSTTPSLAACLLPPSPCNGLTCGKQTTYLDSCNIQHSVQCPACTCGDGVCNNGESCSSCPTDCGGTCPETFCPVPKNVDGVCSSVPGSCSIGNVYGDNWATTCGTTRTWSCSGINGGATVSCSSANSACPVPCQGAWSDCSAACDGGTQKYVITTYESNGGASCPYPNNASRSCNTQDCLHYCPQPDGLIGTIPDSAINDGGMSGQGDSLEVYCRNNVIRLCLTYESCAWRSPSTFATADSKNCSGAYSPLQGYYMANGPIGAYIATFTGISNSQYTAVYCSPSNNWVTTCVPANNCGGGSCGAANDGCGGSINCGSCGAGYSCVGGTCQTQASEHSCFPAGTPVLMADGSSKNIEDVKIGDKVMSYNETSEDKSSGEVKAIDSPIRDHMCQIDFADGELLKVTNDHPLLSDGGWKVIDLSTRRDLPLVKGQISVGDRLLSEDGSYKTISKISCWSQKVQMYDLNTVEDYHNYYAGDFLAHNCQ